MPAIDLKEILLEATNEVLEVMFFTGVEDQNALDDSVPKVAAELGFHGQPSGRFGVNVSLEAGKQIAANFLGLDEATDSQAAEVVCELSNMLCGSVLSRIEAGARFELLHPEIDSSGLSWRDRPGAIGWTFGLSEGVITVWMALNGSIICLPAPPD
jgi:CheY-specific phosphatase CheX